MRSTSTRKLITATYGLGLIWIVAMVAGAVVLMQPMLALYDALGIEPAVVHTVLTMSLVVLNASAITVVVGLVLRAAAADAPASHRSDAVRAAASRRA